MAKRIKSQHRETLEEAGLELVERLSPDEVILFDPETRQYELWVENDHYAGAVVVIKGKGYEFVRNEGESIDPPAEDEFHPQEDDIYIRDKGVFQDGKLISRAVEWDDIIRDIGRWMKKHQFFPNVWQVSDHGNISLVTDL